MSRRHYQHDSRGSNHHCLHDAELQYGQEAGHQLELERDQISACVRLNRSQMSDTVRGMVPLGEDRPNISSIIAVRVLPNISELSCENGRGRIGGVFDIALLYMPAGSDRPASARSTMAFSLDIPQMPEDESLIDIDVVSAEASALMGDRVDMKIAVNLLCETRMQEEISFIGEVKEGEEMRRRPGYIICWPGADEDAWTLAKRYAVSEDEVAQVGVEPGRPLVLRV